MIPISLHLKNFMGHDESDIDFSKLNSIIFIIGNEDGSIKKSNAVGKTTLFYAIRYALFNATSAKKTIKTIKRGKSKCEVTFCFKMSDGNEYKIYRHLSSKAHGVNFYIKKDNDWEEKTDRTATDTNLQILNIIKTNLTTFENTSYFKQNDLMNLAQAKPERRKEIISSLLELGIWEKYKELCKKKKEPFETELKTILLRLNELNDCKNSLSVFQQECDHILAEKTKEEKDLNDLRKDFSDKKEKLNNLKNLTGDKKQIEEKYNDAYLFLQENKENVQYIQNSIKEHSQLIQDENTKILKYNKVINEKTVELTNLLKNMPEEVDSVGLEKSQNLLIKLRVNLKEKQALIKSFKKPLPNSASCSECSTVLDDSKRKQLIEYKTQEANKLEKEIVDLEAKIGSLSEAIQNAERQLLAYTIAKEKNIKISNELSVLNLDVKKIEQNIIDYKKRIKTLKEKEIKGLEILKKSEDSYNEIKEIKVAFMRNDHLKEIELLNEELKELSACGKQKSKLVQELNTQYGGVLEKINQATKNITTFEELSEKKEELEYLVNVYNTAVLSFSSKGIPFMIINSVLDSIQEETNKVLKLLRGNMQTQFVLNKIREKDGEVQDTLEMKFFVNTEEWDYDELSGGQQGSVALALKFAMAVVSRKRCGSDIKLLLLDEVDQPLDEESLDSFYEVLKLWSKDMTIMVITHNKQLKEKLNKHILVMKQNDCSSASIV